METNRTKVVQSHWCPAATGKNARQEPPSESCKGPHRVVIACCTETLTARQVRRFKARPGEVKVTWSNGSMSWEAE